MIPQGKGGIGGYETGLNFVVKDEEEFLTKVNKSQPIGIRGRGMGIPNLVGNYDNTIRQLFKDPISAAHGSLQTLNWKLLSNLTISKGAGRWQLISRTSTRQHGEHLWAKRGALGHHTSCPSGGP